MMRGSGGIASVRRVAALAALVLAAVAAPASAQLARQVAPDPNAPKLIVVPFARESADSTLSVTVADGLRDRLRASALSLFNVIPKNIMNENLEASGFSKDVPLEGNVARQLARFLNVRVLVEGSILRRPGDSALIVARLAELTGAAPQSASASALVPLSRASGQTGSELANRLRDAYRSFEHVLNCNRFADSSDWRRAEQAAQRALSQFSQSAGAHLCVAKVRRGQGASQDSILDALLRARAADSLNSLVLRQVARFFEERNDTARLVPELRRILSVDVGDTDLRIRVAQMLIRRNAGRDTALARSDADSAVAIIDEGLTRNPSQVELLKARSIALGAAGRFGDAAATLAQVAEVDSSNIDSLFAVRITNYYQLVPDSARLLEWTRIITQRLPDLAPYWYSLSLLLASTGDTAAAVTAIQRFLQAQPNDARGHIVYASYLLGPSRTNNGLEDSALAHARIAAEADTALRNSAAQVALSVGARYLQPPADFEKAAARLQLAADWSSGRIKVAASYYLGVAQIQMGFKADSVTNASRDCDAARQLPDLWNRAEANIIAGAAQNREQANILLTQHIPAFKQRAEAFVRNFCR